MKLLFCCEFYYPSIGGVQEVMRQLAERMARRGHAVTVATTLLADRDFAEYNGVTIVEFAVAGNLVRGMEGEVERYREFVRGFCCDALLVKAAQQWTFDALWPVLDQIHARKVFIPCGFSGFYEPDYKKYFEDLPAILHKWDHLIFYADNYRDTQFARQIGYSNLTIVPNGASEVEFSPPQDASFRARYGIPEESFVLFTVGTLTGMKGHREVAEAFALLDTGGKHTTLILNGNRPLVVPRVGPQHRGSVSAGLVDTFLDRGRSLASGFRRASVHYLGYPRRALRVFRRDGWAGVRDRIEQIALRQLSRVGWPPSSRGGSSLGDERESAASDPLQLKRWIDIARKNPMKRVILVDLPRKELIQAYLTADLFVFASKVEYSPLVLYESAAAGTPFLSSPAGNAEEIARWTRAGIICPGEKDERGYTKVDTSVLAREIRKAMDSPEQLASLGREGRSRWQQYFTWDEIASHYEEILEGKGSTGGGFMFSAS